MSFLVPYTDLTLFFLKGIDMRKSQQHRHTIQQFEIHRLYRSGMNFKEIASHLKMNEKDVAPHLFSYINKHKIDISELELHRSNVHKAKVAIEQDKKPNYQVFNESVQQAVKASQAAYDAHVNASKKKSWFSRCCSSIKNFVFFWK